jgi:membrane protease YdiL (CAAX protease family)
VAVGIAMVLAPIALMVGFSIAGELAAGLAGGGTAGAMLYAAVLVLGAAVTFGLLRWMAAARGIDPPPLGRPVGLGLGTGAGFVASIGSAALFYLVQRPRLADPPWTALRPLRAVANIGPAVLEEVAFRAGVVHVVATAWGEWAGLLSGSVPFGALHVLGVIFGRPPSLSHVIGVSAGGWLLSLLYLRLGLGAAFACHWIWNALASSWIRLFQLPKPWGEILFEGAWTTDLVLVLLCIALHALLRRGRRHGGPPAGRGS